MTLRGKRGEQGDYNLVGLAGLRKNAMSIILYTGRMFMNFHKYLNMDISLLGASCFCLGVSLPCDLILSANLEHSNCEFQNHFEV